MKPMFETNANDLSEKKLILSDTPEVVPNPGPDDNPESESSPCTPTDTLLQIEAPDDTYPDDERPEINLGESSDRPDNSFLESDLANDNDSEEVEEN